MTAKMTFMTLMFAVCAGSAWAGGALDIKPDHDARLLWERDVPAVQETSWTSRIRFPTLELAAIRSQKALTGAERPLSAAEEAEAKAVFGESLDLSRVRIAYALVGEGFGLTLGNTIRVPKGAVLDRSDLIHELAHVWQYQTKGTNYISDSLVHRTALALAGKKALAAGDYPYKLLEGKRLSGYAAEEQAQIIADCVTLDPLKGDARCAALLAEVRSARSLPQGFVADEFGGNRRAPIPVNRFPGFPSYWGADAPPPQFELRF